MTEQKISYLSSEQSFNNRYEKAGLHRGTAGAFMVSVLTKDAHPFLVPTAVPPTFEEALRPIIGNTEHDLSTDPDTLNGWDFFCTRGMGADTYVFRIGDGVGTISSVGKTFFTTQMLANRACLWFIAVGAEDPSKKGTFIGLWLNGQFQGSGPQFGYTPAAANNPLRVLGDDLLVTDNEAFEGSYNDGFVSGFSFEDSVPAVNASSSNFDAIDAIARAQWNETVEALDLVDNSDVGEVFSVRRGAAAAPAVWESSNGPNSLDRVGTPVSGAMRDRFYAA